MIEGVRRYPNKYGFLRLPDGGYGRDLAGRWWCRPPGARTRDLRHHLVEEHLDESVTVAPEIKSGNGAGAFTLERGVWHQI